MEKPERKKIIVTYGDESTRDTLMAAVYPLTHGANVDVEILSVSDATKAIEAQASGSRKDIIAVMTGYMFPDVSEQDAIVSRKGTGVGISKMVPAGTEIIQKAVSAGIPTAILAMDIEDVPANLRKTIHVIDLDSPNIVVAYSDFVRAAIQRAVGESPM